MTRIRAATLIVDTLGLIVYPESGNSSFTASLYMTFPTFPRRRSGCPFKRLLRIAGMQPKARGYSSSRRYRSWITVAQSTRLRITPLATFHDASVTNPTSKDPAAPTAHP